ncbi:ABC transporter permease subunit [Roseobacter sp. HKCCD9010]|uniref:thiamine/thiamine pyrophosphate ABC transporter permease ThiP n=1 Tax=unclassified Roseobacter TaxID=196798 RepID=UPI0014931C2C|nr:MULTISPECIES: thiamine/thiamine pyrophosphate ABC transporter permease ThiP [unclassified Roseobacter]MBF9051039.1 ABC transporter permease subunit [Rhodobacterales bacterium HKCCD4356]NNV12808.1 ABC transporter permease subunit [Roseobacter sp. HKCCD7357]NNV16753.1 ABC transporter permease subunit [Roseobacter sp. HKCCD8768]NNV26615.1 ABC transporter permease subunit [Roseobacter sp. HKCCD8192]NNV30473.1 ABC transporter permease subunit [Roseobacter sp. HKCCD9061]
MAERAQPVTGLQSLGAGIATLVALALLAPLVAVALRAEAASALNSSDWAAIRFTILQALLSAVLSVALAIPVARALARRRFLGRRVLITLMGAPFLLPVIVAVFGLLAVFGRNGWISQALGAFGLPPLEIYGLHGVVLAHVFFNLPLATRLFLQGWQAIPSERVRLAASLGFTPRDIWRHFEMPMLRATAPGAFLVIFLICTTSFAVALTLGGGPRATTVELAIYQAFRFDFDLSRAAMLGAVQVLICASAAILAFRFAVPRVLGSGLDRPAMQWEAFAERARVTDAAFLTIAALFLILPMAALVAKGLPAIWSLPPSVWQAALRSILLAVSSAMLALLVALPMAAVMARRHQTGLELVGTLSIAISPLVLGTGLFLILQPIANPVALALPVTGLVNALMSLPFLLRALTPAFAEAEATQGRLADALGLQGMHRLRHAILPRLRAPLGFGAGLAAALSMGDLGVIALFSSPAQGTLPLEMYRLMGSYRTDDAQGAALLLLFLSLGLFWICDRGGRRRVGA